MVKPEFFMQMDLGEVMEVAGVVTQGKRINGAACAMDAVTDAKFPSWAVEDKAETLVDSKEECWLECRNRATCNFWEAGDEDSSSGQIKCRLLQVVVLSHVLTCLLPSHHFIASYAAVDSSLPVRG